MDKKLRAEALAKLVDNGVSVANMEVWIAGYIAGRKEADRINLLKHEVREFVPYEVTVENNSFNKLKPLDYYERE